VGPTTCFCAGSRNVSNYYYNIIIGRNSTDSNFSRPTVRRRADDIVAADLLATMLCSSFRRQTVLRVTRMAGTPPREGKEPKRETYYSLKDS
jgi:hypothetical protein